MQPMNIFLNLSTKKNSVNSSIATIKPPKDVNETICKFNEKTKTRFSHQQHQNQQPKKLQRNGSYKQGLQVEPCLNQSFVGCMNHEVKAATHMVMRDSDSPMYYCERCAILIASKGFNVEPIESEIDKENKNKINSKRGSYSQNQTKSNQNKKDFPNSQQQNTSKTLSPQINETMIKLSQKPSKIQLSNEVVSELENIWRNLKSGRESNLNQIDMYINTLSENIDFLEDYYYVLHEYVEKQKNLELQEILGKKQLLEQLRAQVSSFFVNSFTSIKQLKEKLMQCGECSLETYQQTIKEATNQKFSLNFEAAIEEVTIINDKKESALHGIGAQIANLIKNYKLIQANTKLEPLEKRRTSEYREDMPKPLSHQPSQKIPNNFNEEQKKSPIPSPYSYMTSKQPQKTFEPPYLPGIQQAESSIRSLQLSFDNSESQSQSPKRARQQSNNFTLNQYINNRQESYTNLLMTSTDMN